MVRDGAGAAGDSPDLPVPGPVDRAFFGPDARFHHVGLAVERLPDLVPEEAITPNRTEGVRMAFVRVGGALLELLEPLGERSPIARSLAEGRKLLHVCFEVGDLESALETCRPEGFHRISPVRAVPEFGGRRIVWVLSREYGLVELIERG